MHFLNLNLDLRSRNSLMDIFKVHVSHETFYIQNYEGFIKLIKLLGLLPNRGLYLYKIIQFGKIMIILSTHHFQAALRQSGINFFDLKFFQKASLIHFSKCQDISG